ncbi:MAG: hypothetical protein CVV02_14610 [Firmicutes bacterium HGW-Firmicutes-7]|nr:MAG: hypothetical protein CVV02_14610 [Firmicutes bacterium HGW-Firmicutes-7]
MIKIYRILFALHFFVGFGALVGGFATIINPEEPLGMSVKYLQYSPFKNYLIPGILLFIVIGLGNVVSAIIVRMKFRFQAYISSIFSWALMIWIVVQCIMLNSVVFIHVFYFIIGLIEAVLSIIILFHQRLFPTNIVIRLLKRKV